MHCSVSREDHPEQYHIEIMKLLCAFVRHPVKDKDLSRMLDRKEKAATAPTWWESRHELREDVQTAMEAICSCHVRQLRLEEQAEFRLNLHGADLKGVRLQSASLAIADLMAANLNQAVLVHADLTKANLAGASLIGTRLFAADLTDANLNGAMFTDRGMQEHLARSRVLNIRVEALESGLTQEQLDRAFTVPHSAPLLDGLTDWTTGDELRPPPGKPGPKPVPKPDEKSDD